MKKATIFLAWATFLACNQSDKTVQEMKYFSKPIVAQTLSNDSAILFSKEFIFDFFPSLVGKYKFTDTLKIKAERTPDNESRNSYFDDRLIGQTDSTRTDGLEILTDYSSHVAWNPYFDKQAYVFYPVYMINQTPNRKALLGKGGCVFGIQEALDTNGYWRPIEGRGFDFCGRGYFGLKIEPNEFVTILFPKYKGDYKTKIRVRIKNGDNIYISQSFDGFINESQLYLEKDGYFYKALTENKASAIEYLFYGAKPFGTDDKDFGGLHATYRFGR